MKAAFTEIDDMFNCRVSVRQNTVFSMLNLKIFGKMDFNNLTVWQLSSQQ